MAYRVSGAAAMARACQCRTRRVPGAHDLTPERSRRSHTGRRRRRRRAIRGASPMYIGLTPELTQLRDELRDYYSKLLTPEVEAELSTGEGIGETPRRIWKQMAADGWAGIGWPKEYGGQGRTASEQLIFFDEAMRIGRRVRLRTI